MKLIYLKILFSAKFTLLKSRIKLFLTVNFWQYENLYAAISEELSANKFFIATIKQLLGVNDFSMFTKIFDEQKSHFKI